MTQSFSLSDYSQDELSVIKQCLESTRSILQDFIYLLENIGELSTEIDTMIETTDNTQVPYCYEYVRLAYIQAFVDYREQIIMLEVSMKNFPDEIDVLVGYVKQQPLSINFNDQISLFEASLEYFKARFEYIKVAFSQHKSLALQTYEETQLLPKACGL